MLVTSYYTSRRKEHFCQFYDLLPQHCANFLNPFKGRFRNTIFKLNKNSRSQRRVERSNRPKKLLLQKLSTTHIAVFFFILGL